MEQLYKQILKSIKAAEKPVFAVFDFDNTCIDGDIGEAVFFQAAKKQDIDLHKNLVAQGRQREADELASRALTGLTVGEVNNITDKVLGPGQLKIKENVIGLLNFLRESGVSVWIVTASCEAVVMRAMKHFGIAAELIGVRNILKDGKLTSELEHPAPWQKGKVDCIKKFISKDKRPILGVGDSINDLPMLEYCILKVVVDCGNELSSKAKEEGWPTL